MYGAHVLRYGMLMAACIIDRFIPYAVDVDKSCERRDHNAAARQLCATDVESDNRSLAIAACRPV